MIRRFFQGLIPTIAIVVVGLAVSVPAASAAASASPAKVTKVATHPPVPCKGQACFKPPPNAPCVTATQGNFSVTRCYREELVSIKCVGSCLSTVKPTPNAPCVTATKASSSTKRCYRMHVIFVLYKPSPLFQRAKVFTAGSSSGDTCFVIPTIAGHKFGKEPNPWYVAWSIWTPCSKPTGISNQGSFTYQHINAAGSACTACTSLTTAPGNGIWLSDGQHIFYQTTLLADRYGGVWNAGNCSLNAFGDFCNASFWINLIGSGAQDFH